MIEIAETKTKEIPTVKMRNMKPMQVGVVVTDDCKQGYIGRYVMRTASTEKFEVMDLSKPGQNKCWTGNPNLEVRLLEEGESITLTLRNK